VRRREIGGPTKRGKALKKVKKKNLPNCVGGEKKNDCGREGGFAAKEGERVHQEQKSMSGDGEGRENLRETKGGT